jgi:hypothetical protein
MSTDIQVSQGTDMLPFNHAMHSLAPASVGANHGFQGPTSSQAQVMQATHIVSLMPCHTLLSLGGIAARTFM